MISMKRYKLNKRVKNFLIFYTFICVSFIVSYTFSRYVTTSSSNYVIGIAKFNVLVNGIDVIDGESFNLNLSPNANTYNNKIVPNSEGYFEIIIDPNLTEVSLEYEFAFNLSNLDEDLVLSKCILNDKDELPFTDNTIKGEILLPNTNKGFTSEDVLNIKIYWEWNEEKDIINPTIDNTNVLVTSLIKQKID